VNYRPEYQHGWGSKTYYRQLRIDPLPPESAEALLHGLLGGDPALQPLKALLIERTEGNPFFLEESVQTLVETGGLAGERGAYRLGRPLPAIQVPPTVQAVLAARIDRLPAEEKQLLQSAAVIGKDVPLPLLQAIADLPEDVLRPALARCQAAELLYQTSLFAEPEYTFKHALTHEVAYQSLLQDRQRALHARIVEELERLHAGRLAEQVERLAHHALRGGVLDKAVRYLREAGTRALARSANREAVGFFEQALEVLGRLPETRETLSGALDVRLALGSALIALKGAAAPEVEACYARAHELCSRLDEAARLFPAVWGLWYVHYGRGNFRAAGDLGDRLLTVARDRNESALTLEAHHALWATLFGKGDVLASHQHVAQGLVLYHPEVHRGTTYLYGNHDPGVCCRNFSCWGLWELGFADQALARTREATRLARELGHAVTSATALTFAACLHLLRGELDAAEEMAAAALTLAHAQGLRLWIQFGETVSAILAVERGRHADGIAQLRERLPALGGWRFIIALCALADAYGRVREPHRGLEVLAEGLATAQRNAIGSRLPEVYRLQGELLALQAGRLTGEAEAALHRALDLSRTRQERALELRAATSHARWLREAGRRDEARRLLAPVYGSFTEGLETRDLRDARAVLDSL
jgi:hypothetical protein